MSAGPPLTARLDRTGRRVLCARLSCGAQLAAVRHAMPETGGHGVMALERKGFELPEEYSYRDERGLLAIAPEPFLTLAQQLACVCGPDFVDPRDGSVAQVIARQEPSVIADLRLIAREEGRTLHEVILEAQRQIDDFGYHSPEPQEAHEFAGVTHGHLFSVLTYPGLNGQIVMKVEMKPARRDLVLGMGWKCGQDGVWCMTKRAAGRLRRGRTPTFRRDPFGKSNRRLTGTGEVIPVHLPLAARCPSCGLVQTLAADTLKIDPFPEMHLVHPDAAADDGPLPADFPVLSDEPKRFILGPDRSP